MIRSNTRRQIYLGLTVASYLYFLGDAAVNYRYDASPVKKATTLATIFPGAGQVYNKSYWKLPFVVGGLATTIYTIDWNNRGYQRFKKAYSLRSAYDKALEAYQKIRKTIPIRARAKTNSAAATRRNFSKTSRTITAATATYVSSSLPDFTCCKSSTPMWTLI